MNTRSQIFELKIEGKQTDEALASIFHTVLFHRTLGKFLYSDQERYEIGSLGYTDVDCDYIDLTYVCCTSPQLDRDVRREIGEFSQRLRQNENSGGGGGVGARCGTISLQFYEQRNHRWSCEYVPWEMWTVCLELITLANENERAQCREKVGEVITEKIICITDEINKHEKFTPKIPKRSELGCVFDTKYEDVQPYLFKFNSSLSGPSPTTTVSVATTVKQLLRDAFSF